MEGEGERRGEEKTDERRGGEEGKGRLFMKKMRQDRTRANGGGGIVVAIGTRTYSSNWCR